MKRFIALFVAILFVFGVASISFAYPQAEKAMPKAEEKKAEPAKKEAPKAKVKQVTGEVTAVDVATKTIKVKGKKAEIALTADEKMLADVKVGDKVVVKYTEEEGKNIAKSIKKSAPKAKMEEKKAKPAKPAEPEKKK
jgi:hypothetical protein